MQHKRRVIKGMRLRSKICNCGEGEKIGSKSNFLTMTNSGQPGGN